MSIYGENCYTFLHDNDFGGSVYVSGTTCLGVVAAYTLNFGESVCMDMNFPLITCGNPVFSFRCNEPTPTPTRTVTPTRTPTPTVTPTNTNTPSITPTKTPTRTPNALCTSNFQTNDATPPQTIPNASFSRIATYSGGSIFDAYLNLTSDTLGTIVLGTAPDSNSYSFFSAFTSSASYFWMRAFSGTTDLGWSVKEIPGLQDVSTTQVYTGDTAYGLFSTLSDGGLLYPTTGFLNFSGGIGGGETYMFYNAVCTTPTPTPTNTSTPSFTPTNTSTPTFTPTTTNTPTPSSTIGTTPPTTPTQTQTPTSTQEPICPSQITLTPSSDFPFLQQFGGTYDRLYSYTGGSFNEGYFSGTSSTAQTFFTGSLIGNNYVVYGKYTGGTDYYTIIVRRNGTNTPAFLTLLTTGDYAMNVPFTNVGYAINNTVESSGGFTYPARGSGIGNFYISYPENCPTPTQTPSQTSTPTGTLSITPTPTTTSTPTITSTPTSTLPVSPTPSPTQTEITSYSFSNCGVSNTSANGACSDSITNPKTLYSNCLSLSAGCLLYYNSNLTNPVTELYVFALSNWDMDGTGQITGPSSVQC